jgi:TrmH family RNA methyltransferase
VEEIIASGLTIRHLYTTRPNTTYNNATLIDTKSMERISQLKSATEVLAVVEQPRHTLNVANLGNKLSLALDGVQNPGNLGTIIRLADWFGVEDVICSTECADLYNAKVVQATMGALLRVKVHYTDNLAELLRSAANSDIPIYGTLLDGNNMYDRPLTQSGIIVMGNEGKGISPSVSNLVSDRLFIPNYPSERTTTESLNVAVATAIICAEFRRRM